MAGRNAGFNDNVMINKEMINKGMIIVMVMVMGMGMGGFNYSASGD